MENKIYFPIFYGERLVFFSLETKKKFTRLRTRMLSLICIAQGKSCVAVGLNLGGASMPLLEEAEFVFHPIQG